MNIPRMIRFSFNSFQKYVFFPCKFQTLIYDSTDLQYPRIADSRTICNAYFTNSLALRPSESLGLLNDRCPFSSAHCYNITLTLIISVFCLHSLWFSYDAQNKQVLFFKWHRSDGLFEGKGVCFL
jgi:hypothetical protein